MDFVWGFGHSGAGPTSRVQSVHTSMLGIHSGSDLSFLQDPDTWSLAGEAGDMVGLALSGRARRVRPSKGGRRVGSTNLPGPF